MTKLTYAVLLLFTTTRVMPQSFITFLDEGANCTVPETNIAGLCININKCEYVKKLQAQNKHPPICGLNIKYPLACCPDKPKKPGEKSIEMCKKYFNPLHRVWPVDLGEKALAKEFKHMAAVGFTQNTTVLWLCGGSLISRLFVLTAAHCVKSKDFGPAHWVRLGDLDLMNTTDIAHPLDIVIARSYVHPDYRSSSHYHDIALLKLERELSFRQWFQPACLHTTFQISNAVLQVTGWGKMGFFGEPSSHLMKANLSLVNHGTCAKKYKNVSRRRLAMGVRDEYQICAGDAEGRDTCPGDSGGPLHFKVENTQEIDEHFVVVGVTSFGKGCGGPNTAGVYTRVSAYIGWIEKIVWEEDDYA